MVAKSVSAIGESTPRMVVLESDTYPDGKVAIISSRHCVQSTHEQRNNKRCPRLLVLVMDPFRLCKPHSHCDDVS